MPAYFNRAFERVSETWRTSLQVRVIGLIFIASVVVMTILGMALISVVTSRLVDTKLDIADSEIDRARVAVEQQIDATSATSTVQVRLNSARAALTQRSAASGTAAVYEPVLVVAQQDGSTVTSPEGYRIPEKLRHFVSEDQVSFQFTSAERSDGSAYNALVIGTPTDTDVTDLQVYLVLSMESDEQTLALLRGLLSAAGVVVVVLLVGIAWLATQQVTAPVRSASRIAQRLAAGHLRERMVVDGEDEMARLAVSFNDMAEKLSKQIHQLEEYGNLQRQFTSDVSHELRTPLTTVRMAADMIASDPESLEPHTRRASELMIRELDRFEELLADLLEISRHDAGVADLSEARIDARSCITSAWEQTRHLAQKLEVDVVFHTPDEPVMFTGDSRRIERVLRNLIANAIDHSEGNPVEVALAANDETVAITVTDHGVGLKPGQEELVFNRFWRADASRRRHSGGTGLGLAIAREDVVLHGGQLDAAGTSGVGSQFRVVLPRQPQHSIANSPLALEAPIT
ncbi:MAG: MtrAB system histidine kinase MtrB [Corynebacterium sp.]|uniref:MtrAB system histidine kinase MtrB n=1 Tax=Corynebacterium sp. TaxID=1720 RepID=UPI0026DF8CE2|nr:MtrAB system histidine kinase MtrB [Corynebacterium sp.]MDO5669427.1 MtrAB system histidine kinase MtrB [Corynebacterium sp.]